MLAAQVHIGTRNSDSQMQDYIWRRRQVKTEHGCIWNPLLALSDMMHSLQRASRFKNER